MNAPRRGTAATGALAFALALSACGNPAPEPAQFIPPPQSHTELDGLRARYNLLPTLALGEAVAREYGVGRAADTALLVVALRRDGGDGDETTADGEVSAEAVDLAGRRQAVAMRRIATGDYVDHVGLVRIGTRDTMRVHVTVVADGRRQEFDFQRSF
ncbi:DUF4426 domain-containing protein [Pseudoxanthomonas koreensis]|uniref:DUF4426 domain-containing protein n=1 Tax=Pseudoxanthomonas koreensis TaxID=266061 RepID=UPI001390D42B|nr:DUF4426 domain-containing protein [Pseudoxanthomonas koreensis]KAF1690208.1 hypothetical protein CSC64_11700 [Pseudoxanthomonas koreensis]